MGRRGIKEYRAPEALALIAADREHTPLVCPSCGTRSIVRSPRRRGGVRTVPAASERITLTWSPRAIRRWTRVRPTSEAGLNERGD